MVGLASDSTNKLLVTAGSDGALRVWDFRKQKLVAELPLGAGATHLVLHAGSGLAAVACVDRVVHLVDIEAARVVRRFSGHRCDAGLGWHNAVVVGEGRACVHAEGAVCEVRVVPEVRPVCVRCASPACLPLLSYAVS